MRINISYVDKLFFAILLGLTIVAVPFTTNIRDTISLSTASAATAACANPIVRNSTNDNFFAGAPPGTQYACGGSDLQGNTNTQYFDQNWTPLDGGQFTSAVGGPPLATDASGNVKASKPPECVESDGWFTCALVTVIIRSLAAFAEMFVYLMRLADKLFNLAISSFATSAGFNNLYSMFASSVATVWTLARDIANIILIGLFVFIAIGIILGLKEYGQKKLVARVLVVAVLINFSFLFTRIIINASNSMSQGIYGLLSNEISKSAVSTSGDTNPGIGDFFNSTLQIASVQGGVRSGLSAAYKTDPTGSLAQVFLKTLGIIIFNVLATIAFLWGTFILAARFLALVFILVLSSLAFATYLLPNWAAVGWSAWWNQLIKNAILAPMLMLFMWMGVVVAEGLQKFMGTSGLGLDVANATNTQAVLGYALILGLLFAGLYIASKLSTQVALHVTTAIPSIGAGLVTAGGGYGFGMYQAARSRTYKARAKEAAERGDGALAARYTRIADKKKESSKRDWNIMNSSAAKLTTSALGGLGLKGAQRGLQAGQFKMTPYGKGLEEKTKKAVDRYGAGYSSGMKTVRENAAKENAEETGQKAQLTRAKEELQVAVTNTRGEAQNAVEQQGISEQQLKTLLEQRQTINTQHEAAVQEHRTIETQVRAGTAPQSALDAAQSKKDALERQLRSAEEAIQTARIQVDERRQEASATRTAYNTARTTHEEKEREERLVHATIKKAQLGRVEAREKSFKEGFLGRTTRFKVDPNLKAAMVEGIADEKKRDFAATLKSLNDEISKNQPSAPPPASAAPPAEPAH